jgi:lipoprotein-releasing system ATP-binding protein
MESLTSTSLEAPCLLSVRGVTKSFRLGSRTIEVLRGVDLEIPPGAFMAIRGSSGAGKSTLLHILGLLDRPTSGSIVYGGRELAGAGERERSRLRATEFAFIFQFYYLLPEFTALENVVIPSLIAGSRGRGPKGRAARQARARELLERVGLGARLSHRSGELSGGERQRVAIARALINEPRIVFCDEPTGNLDSRTAEGIHELLRELNETMGQTLVVVTHEPVMAEVARVRLEMLDGRIVAHEGPALEQST